MHKSICELQEVNKDVLLGKKSVNCLSCNKGNDGYEALQQFKGKDGKLYVGSGHTLKDLPTSDGPSIDNIYPKAAYLMNSPKSIVKNKTGNYNSISMSANTGG
jgi:hypothetical protein